MALGQERKAPSEDYKLVRVEQEHKEFVADAKKGIKITAADFGFDAMLRRSSAYSWKLVTFRPGEEFPKAVSKRRLSRSLL